MTESIVEAVKAEGLQGQCPIDHTKYQQSSPTPPPAKCPIDHTKLATTPAPAAAPAPEPVVETEISTSVSEGSVTSETAASQKITTAQVCNRFLKPAFQLLIALFGWWSGLQKRQCLLKVFCNNWSRLKI